MTGPLTIPAVLDRFKAAGIDDAPPQVLVQLALLLTHVLPTWSPWPPMEEPWIPSISEAYRVWLFEKITTHFSGELAIRGRMVYSPSCIAAVPDLYNAFKTVFASGSASASASASASGTRTPATATPVGRLERRPITLETSSDDETETDETETDEPTLEIQRAKHALRGEYPTAVHGNARDGALTLYAVVTVKVPDGRSGDVTIYREPIVTSWYVSDKVHEARAHMLSQAVRARRAIPPNSTLGSATMVYNFIFDYGI